MKMKWSYAPLAILLALTIWTVGPTVAQNVACYMDQGGAGWHLGSGCTLTVESGGALNVASGGAFKLGGTSVNLMAGVGSGYRVARGTVTLDGSNPTPVSHGLTTVVSCQLTDVRSDSPGLDPVHFTYVISGDTLNIYAWKYTHSSNPTLIASTDSDDVIGWSCVGT